MNYWLTTHWPLRRGEENEKWRYYVFLPDGREQAGREMQPSDLIFIYESKTGRRLKGQEYDYYDGREGIIALVRAISRPERTENEPDEYANGSEIWWAWQVRTELVKECFIPREDVCRALGYSLNYNFRGFGDYRSGLKRLTEDQFKALLKVSRGSMKFVVTIEQDEDGMFIAECPTIPGCVSQGKTEQEALENIKDAIKQCLEVRAEKGMPLTVATREIEILV